MKTRNTIFYCKKIAVAPHSLLLHPKVHKLDSRARERDYASAHQKLFFIFFIFRILDKKKVFTFKKVK